MFLDIVLNKLLLFKQLLFCSRFKYIIVFNRYNSMTSWSCFLKHRVRRNKKKKCFY